MLGTAAPMTRLLVTALCITAAIISGEVVWLLVGLAIVLVGGLLNA